jgi:hypothetical protein
LENGLFEQPPNTTYLVEDSFSFQPTISNSFGTGTARSFVCFVDIYGICVQFGAESKVFLSQTRLHSVKVNDKTVSNYELLLFQGLLK